MKAPLKTWGQRARQAVQEGYRPGNPWEKSLQRHLEQNFLDQVRELRRSGELKAYLQVMTWAAMQLAESLEERGTPPDVARELALDQLLPTPPEQQDQTQPWETEANTSALEEAVERFLLPPTSAPK